MAPTRVAVLLSVLSVAAFIYALYNETRDYDMGAAGSAFSKTATQNLSRDKLAHMSSRGRPGATPWRGVDGELSCDCKGNGVLTARENSPWFEVDLGDTYAIEDIKVYFPACDTVVGNHYRVYVSEHSFQAHGEFDSSWTDYFDTGLVPDMANLHVGPPPGHGEDVVLGRYVKVQLVTPGMVNLCEVEVFGQKVKDVCGSNLHDCHPRALCYNDHRHNTYTCSCRLGYHGDGRSCEAEKDLCEGVKCHKFAECFVSSRHGFQEPLCRCGPGYFGDGVTDCRLADPCTSLNSPCHPNAECEVDEDTIFGYTCTCKRGFTGNGFECHNVNPCDNGRHNCSKHADCINHDPTDLSQFTCQCRAGFEGDGLDCDFVNYCETTEEEFPCHKNAICQNAPGSVHGYYCSCKRGFTGDGKTCKSVDPCTSGMNDCHQNAHCIATFLGHYNCECNEGYKGDGFHCEPSDICKTSANNCDKHATCTQADDQPAGFRCECERGYRGDGLTCDLVNACIAGHHDCARHATCIVDHETNHWRCECKPGFEGNGFFCALKDACLAGADNCDANARCVATDTSFKCECQTGYVGDGLQCTLDNPCAAQIDDCSRYASCVSERPGQHLCTCMPGYEGDGHRCTWTGRFGSLSHLLHRHGNGVVDAQESSAPLPARLGDISHSTDGVTLRWECNETSGTRENENDNVEITNYFIKSDGIIEEMGRVCEAKLPLQSSHERHSVQVAACNAFGCTWGEEQYFLF